jgi:hypothetical protein
MMQDGNLLWDHSGWGYVSHLALYGVLQSACDVLVAAFGNAPDAPVRVVPGDEEYRWVRYDRRPYENLLEARERHWSQYVYQFSHELLHVMTNYDRYKERKHQWFEEALGELASLFVLHRLADGWALNPPPGVPSAAEFARNHRTYSMHIERRGRLPAGTDIPQWFPRNIRDMEADPYKRELNGSIAVCLLAHFWAEPSLWQSCGLLNTWNTSQDATFSDYLTSWCGRLRSLGINNRAPTTIQRILL